MQGLLTRLGDCYVKERGHLVCEVLGVSGLSPAPAFLKRLAGVLDLPSIEGPVFGGMDYHLDWLHDSLCGLAGIPAPGDIRRTQQDVDFLVAFTEGSATHVVLIEAKGIRSWSNEQIDKKVKRLTGIFGRCGGCWPGVIPHLLLMSPRAPRRVPCESWPDWMKRNGIDPLWIRLPFPEKSVSTAR